MVNGTPRDRWASGAILRLSATGDCSYAAASASTPAALSTLATSTRQLVLSHRPKIVERGRGPTLRPVTNLEALQTWFLRQLETDLRRSHPDIAQAFDAAPPGSDAELGAWASRLQFDPPEPWTTLSGVALGLELSLDQMNLTLRSLPTVTDGRTAWFLVHVSFVQVTACIEALEQLAKRMERSGLIGRPRLDGLLERTSDHTSGVVESMRNSFAHGPQQRIEDNWFGAIKRQRLWELMALNKEDAAGILDTFYDIALERRDQRHNELVLTEKSER